jgi:hypothetical protein
VHHLPNIIALKAKKKVLNSVLENVDVKIVNKFCTTNPFTQGTQE